MGRGKKRKDKSQGKRPQKQKRSAEVPPPVEKEERSVAEVDSGIRKRARPGSLVVLVIAVVAIAAAVLVLANRSPQPSALEFPEPSMFASSTTAPTFDDFIGSESCEECHEDQYNLWLGSTHGRAGGWPSPDIVIAPFDGNPMRFFDAVVTPSITESGSYIFTVEQGGNPPVVLEVAGVVGGGHMVGGGTQGFVSSFADGTVRFLPFDYIRDEAVWFCNTLGMGAWVPITESMRLSDCMDWPPNRILGTERRNDTCQECHGSQILLTYDEEAGRYDTKILSLDINCESCHGPGRLHVELADAGFPEDAEDLAVNVLSGLDKDGSLNVCFQCHALKSVVSSEYLPGKPLHSHYSLKSWLVGESPFHPDGRIRTFAYQQNHVYSDCYLNGSMTCVDCHDPHSQEYRDIWGRTLSNRFADEQCTDCHPSKAENPELHTFHEPGTEGSLCVDCHMPYLQHPSLGRHLRFARSDHTIPIPRPGTDDRMGIVNACAQAECHADSTIQSLVRITNEWYGEIKPRKNIIEGMVQIDQLDNRVAAAEFLLDPAGAFPIAQVTAMGRFARQFLEPDMRALEPSIVEALIELAGNDDLDVRSVALATLHLARGNETRTRAFLAEELRSLGDSDHDVRARWVTALQTFGDWRIEGRSYREAITIFRKALDVLPRNPQVLNSIAWTYNSLGDFVNAVSHYERSLEAAPNQPDVELDLSIARENLGRARGTVR